MVIDRHHRSGGTGSPDRSNIMSNAGENFESIAAELVRVAPTEKAAAFAKKVADQIRSRGVEWIEANVTALQCYSAAEDQYFEVSANRLYFLEKWQMALTA